MAQDNGDSQPRDESARPTAPSGARNEDAAEGAEGRGAARRGPAPAPEAGAGQAERADADRADADRADAERAGGADDGASARGAGARDGGDAEDAGGDAAAAPAGAAGDAAAADESDAAGSGNSGPSAGRGETESSAASAAPTGSVAADATRSDAEADVGGPVGAAGEAGREASAAGAGPRGAGGRTGAANSADAANSANAANSAGSADTGGAAEAGAPAGAARPGADADVPAGAAGAVDAPAGAARPGADAEAPAGAAGAEDAPAGAAEADSGEAAGGDSAAEAETLVAAESVDARLLAGRYRLGAVVGRGGMGTVWEARDEVLGRTVAVKELRLPAGVDDNERRRLVTRTLREAKAIATIRSRGVVTIYDVVDESSRPWIVMELIQGASLADVIRREGPMAPDRAIDIGLAILDVLRAAHAAGIMHRDVKPSNVIVAEEDGRVVLTDFGIAKVEGDPSITSTGMLVGAPSYISPERARGGELGPAADLWSLGALLYCCVEGHPPYDEGSAISTLAAVMHDPVPPPRQAGPLTETIEGLLTKDPAERLTEARTRELLLAAREAAGGGEGGGTDERTVVVGRRPAGTPAGAAPKTPVRDVPAVGAAPRTPAQPPDALGAPATPPPPPSGPGARGRRRVLLVAAVAAVLAAVLGTAFALTRDGGSDSSDGNQETGENRQGGEGGADADDAADDSAGGDGAEGDESGEAGESGDDAGGDSGGEPGTTEPPSSTDPPGSVPENDPDASLPENPEGYSGVTSEEFRFQIALPDGWERIGTAGQNSGAIYGVPGGGGPKVQVDFNDSPSADAAAAWRGLEPAVRSNSTDYRSLGIESVDYRDYPSAADWQFERTEGGERVRVLNRGFRVDDSRGYAIMVTCPAAEWSGEECRTIRATAFQTFRPVE